jgi:hypothetical protein
MHSKQWLSPELCQAHIRENEILTCTSNKQTQGWGGGGGGGVFFLIFKNYFVKLKTQVMV